MHIWFANEKIVACSCLVLKYDHDLARTLSMTSLLLEVPKRFQDILDIVTAYDIYLRLEKSLQLAVNKGDDFGNKLIYVRILGYLIHYVPTDQRLENIVKEITSSVDDSALLNVGKIYYDH